MNMKKTAIVALVAAGLAVFPMLAANHNFGAGHFGGGHMGEQMLKHLATMLDLTESQKASAAQLLSDGKRQAEPVIAELKQSRQDMHIAIRSNNTPAISTLATRQGQLAGQLAEIHGKGMAAFYTLLTPEQKNKAESMHDRWKERAGNFRNLYKGGDR